MGLDGRTAPVGRLGCNRERASCAPRLDHEPAHDPARQQLTTTSGSQVGQLRPWSICKDVRRFVFAGGLVLPEKT